MKRTKAANIVIAANAAAKARPDLTGTRPRGKPSIKAFIVTRKARTKKASKSNQR